MPVQENLNQGLSGKASMLSDNTMQVLRQNFHFMQIKVATAFVSTSFIANIPCSGMK